MILFSHPTGNANVRQAALALAEGGLLAEFWTCLQWDPEAALARLLPGKVRRQFERRALPREVRARARTHPWRELGRLYAPRFGLRRLTRHEVGPCSVDAVFRALDRHVAARLGQLPGLAGVYCGEDGAADTFRAAQELGVRRLYDLPIGYWRAAHALYAEEAEREPGWATTLTGRLDSPAKLARKDEELARADVVFVASSFTRSTLELAQERPGRVVLAPYGAPSPAPEELLARAQHPRLRVLFVGSLGQRKGLSYLMAALRRVSGHVEATFIGRRTPADCAPLDAALRRHRWVETLPHAQVLEEMRRHDVLVFPSLFEGFGLVILEALSQGLPVIATPNTAAPDLYEDEREGYIVPIRSAEAIGQCLEQLIASPARLREMQRAAWERARSLPWDGYRDVIREHAAHETVGSRAV